MLSPETLERYRQMTPSQRLQLTAHLIRENTHALLEGPPDVVARRFELLRRQNDERNTKLLAAFARTGQVSK